MHKRRLHTRGTRTRNTPPLPPSGACLRPHSKNVGGLSRYHPSLSHATSIRDDALTPVTIATLPPFVMTNTLLWHRNKKTNGRSLRFYPIKALKCGRVSAIGTYSVDVDRQIGVFALVSIRPITFCARLRRPL